MNLKYTANHYFKEHDLKTVEPHFTDIWEGRKKLEIRFDDRGFSVGDILHLRQYDIDSDSYSGKRIIADVTHLLKDETFLQKGYCAMSIDNLENIEK